MRTPVASLPVPPILHLLAASCALLAGCAGWEETKTSYLDEVNEFLHRRYPAVHATRDLVRIGALYAPAASQDPRWIERKQGLVREFAEITRATCVIEDLEAYEGDAPARGHLQLSAHGTTPLGVRRSRFDEIEIEYARVGDDWKIVRETVLSTRDVNESSVAFSDEAAVRGVYNVPSIDGVVDRNGELQRYPAGSGVAVGDYNADDLDDIYFVNGDDCRLYRNRGDGTFEDITERTGTSARAPGKSRSALIADFDGDGRDDIFVGRLDGPNILYRQNVDGAFTDIAASAGLTPTLETTSCCAADFDGDGSLDIYVVNGCNITRREPDPIYNALNGFPNALFLGNEGGTFTERAAEAGVDHTGFGLSCAASDYDGAGDTDLFVANDFGFDVLYRNRGDGTFEDVARSAGVTARRASMSSAWGDVDGDGRPELFVGAMISHSKWMIDQPGYPSPAPWLVNLFFRNQVLEVVREMMRGNILYRNNGDGTFTPMAPETMDTGWTWSSVFLDYDNDARLDLYVLNGFISGEDREDL